MSSFQQTDRWEKDYLETRRYGNLRKKRLEAFQILSVEKVLDLGCADGINISILRQLGIKNIIGVDISAYFLKVAKKNNPGTKFVQASAEKLPFKDDEFDVVLVDSVFHLLWNNQKALSEIQRVLKRGGRLCFVEPHKGLLRWILDFATESQLSMVIPFLKKRRQTYSKEKKEINSWLENENSFLKFLEKRGFKKLFCRTELLSVVGCYQKISDR